MGSDTMGLSKTATPILAASIVVVSVMVVGLALFLQRAEANAAANCEAASGTLGKSLVVYLAQSPNKVAPPLSHIPAELPFDAKTSSNDATMEFVRALGQHEPLDKSTLLYLGYMIEDEDDARALAAHYTDKMSARAPLADVIPLGKTRPDGRNALLRIQSLKDRPAGGAWSNWYRDPSRIPVFIERPEAHDGKGLHVVFLDGHVTYFPYTRGNVWPLERGVISALRQMDEFDPNAVH